jgi:hypothetical protein
MVAVTVGGAEGRTLGALVGDTVGLRVGRLVGTLGRAKASHRRGEDGRGKIDI